MSLTQATTARSSVMDAMDLFVEGWCEYKATLRDIFLCMSWQRAEELRR